MESLIEIPRFVDDASIASKWHLRDEAYIDGAEDILQSYLSGQISLIAPDVMRYEVSSAIRKCVRTRHLTNEQARIAIAHFLSLRIPNIGDDDIIVMAFEFTVRFNCSMYDGVYLALAEAIGCPLIDADDRLCGAINGRFRNELWIEDRRFLST